MPTENRESGNVAVLYSLGGTPGRRGEGRAIRVYAFAIGVASEGNLIGSNPNRLWLTINNDGPGELRLRITKEGSGLTSWIISPKGFLVFNVLLPYTGGLYGYAIGGDCAVYVTEASNA